MPKDSREFQTFQRVINNAPALLLLEPAYLDPVERARLPHLISIVATYSDRTRDGLPTPKAFDSLASLDDLLDKAARSLKSAIPVTMTTQGRRTWLWYTAAPKPSLDAIHTLNTPLPIKIHDAPDPNWLRFEDALPTPEEVRWNGDLMVIDQLAANGDDPTQEHDLEHLAVFPTRDARDKFITWLHEEEFDLAANQPPSSKGHWPVEFVKPARINLEEIYEQTWACTVAAAEFGGDYDGWQTNVIPLASKPPKPSASKPPSKPKA